MTTNCRIKWESIEEFIPPLRLRYKHISEEEVNPFNRARAQKAENALVELINIQKSGSQAERKHRKKGLHNIVHCPLTLWLPHRVKIQKRNTELSQLEALPLAVLWRIVLNIPSVVDLICFILTSTAVAKSLSLRFSTYRLHSISVPPPWWALHKHIELMERLATGWMPKELVFCHHCMVFLRKLEFDPSTFQESLCCMACRYRSDIDSGISGAMNPIDDGGEEKSWCYNCEVFEEIWEGIMGPDGDAGISTAPLEARHSPLWSEIFEPESDSTCMWDDDTGEIDVECLASTKFAVVWMSMMK